jgi:hypothetical protein
MSLLAEGKIEEGKVHPKLVYKYTLSLNQIGLESHATNEFGTSPLNGREL